jgi:hypothetical protein
MSSEQFGLVEDRVRLWPNDLGDEVVTLTSLASLSRGVTASAHFHDTRNRNLLRQREFDETLKAEPLEDLPPPWRQLRRGRCRVDDFRLDDIERFPVGRHGRLPGSDNGTRRPRSGPCRGW